MIGIPVFPSDVSGIDMLTVVKHVSNIAISQLAICKVDPRYTQDFEQVLSECDKYKEREPNYDEGMKLVILLAEKIQNLQDAIYDRK